VEPESEADVVAREAHAVTLERIAVAWNREV
jgi:hypothetical protein